MPLRSGHLKCGCICGLVYAVGCIFEYVGADVFSNRRHSQVQRFREFHCIRSDLQWMGLSNVEIDMFEKIVGPGRIFRDEIQMQ